MRLTQRFVPDHKTIADFRRGNARAFREVCARFVGPCREMDLLVAASLAIDVFRDRTRLTMPLGLGQAITLSVQCMVASSRRKNNRDRNFARAKLAGRAQSRSTHSR
jgi:hypothetical protein